MQSQDVVGGVVRGHTCSRTHASQDDQDKAPEQRERAEREQRERERERAERERNLWWFRLYMVWVLV